jgi:hypothetical protein
MKILHNTDFDRVYYNKENLDYSYLFRWTT